MPTDDALDLEAITARQQSTWARGDFNVLALQVLPASEGLIRSVDPHAGQRVLDVACGSGNAALVAARRYCEVTGIDYVPALIERAKQRAAAEGTAIDFQVADAQALPFADATFDAVTSVFGVMFAPDQAKAASELVRVCKPARTIGLACWTPESLVGDFFRAHTKHVPPPTGLTPATRWGTVAGIEELLGDRVTYRFERRIVRQYFRDMAHAIHIFRTYFGPTNSAFEAVGEAGAVGLALDIATVFERYNRATDGTLIIEGEYLETIATKR